MELKDRAYCIPIHRLWKAVVILSIALCCQACAPAAVPSSEVTEEVTVTLSISEEAYSENLVESVPPVEVFAPGMLSVTRLPLFRDYAFGSMFDTQETVAYTPVAEGERFQFSGHSIGFVLRNDGSEDRLLVKTLLDIEEIELDASENCMVGYLTTEDGDLALLPKNIGWGDVAAGTVRLHIPEEFQAIFSQSVYEASTHMLTPGQEHEAVPILSAADLLYVPEEGVTVAATWSLETPNGIMKTRPNSGRLARFVDIRFNAEGISAYAGPIGFEDGPHIRVDPTSAIRSYANDENIVVPAQSTIALFSDFGAEKSCRLRAKVSFQFENGEILESEAFSGHHIIPLLKEERFDAVSDQPFRLGYYPTIWRPVSPFDPVRFVAAE